MTSRGRYITDGFVRTLFLDAKMLRTSSNQFDSASAKEKVHMKYLTKLQFNLPAEIGIALLFSQWHARNF